MRSQVLKITALFLLPLFAQAADLCEGWKMPVNTSPAVIEPHAQSFLWKVSKPGLPPSYLLGSFHSDAGHILKNWEGLIVLLGQMNSFISETSFAQDDAFTFGRLTQSKDPMLANILGQEFFVRGRDILHSYRLDDDTISHLKPWAAFLQMVQPPTKVQSLDAYLYSQSRKVPLQLLPLQNAVEMAASAEAISASDQLSILKDTICNRPTMLEQADNLEQLYTADNVPGFLAESDHWLSSKPGVYERFNAALVTNRNAIFLPRLSPALEKGGAFIAVGAAHLFGSNGLISALMAEGYQLEPENREQLMQKLFTQANGEANGLAAELTSWLSAQHFSPKAIQIRFAPTAELEKRACGGPCEVSLFPQGSTLYASIELYHDLRNHSPQASTAVLAQIIRTSQVAELAAKGESHCSAWSQKNVENIILQGRYLSGKGLGVAGLSALEVPNDCIP
ncbi:MAG: TraB/GumN family protein [Bdellovibrionota bacterium]